MFKNKKIVAAISVALALILAIGAYFIFFFNVEEVICEDNEAFIKSVEVDVDITVLAEADHYVKGGMDYDATRYGINYVDGGNKLHNKYYDLTIKTLKEYPKLNERISLNFIAYESEEAKAIMKEYPDTMFYYGDIIVRATVGEAKRIQTVNFVDIYSLITDSATGTSSIGSSDVETAVSSAIATVITAETKTVGLITGHSDELYTEEFKDFFLKANYEVEIIKNSDIESIPENVDALVLAAPTVDFTETELAAVEAFLENGGNLDKGLMYFASPNTANLPNVKKLLSTWGVEVKKGILFEDTEGNFIPGSPTIIGVYPTEVHHEIAHMAGVCIVGNNAVLEKGFETKNRITVSEMYTTPQTASIAPVGANANWKADESTKGINYLAVSLSEKTAYVQNQKKITSVVVFSTVDFFMIPETEFTVLGNRDVVEAATKTVLNYKNQTITFIPKVIAD